MARMTTRHHKWAAFTLVELLVVIGIIALLISILLPALSKAKDAARLVACQSQLRQIGLGVAAYAVEFNDFMPPTGGFYREKSPAGSGLPDLYGRPCDGGTPWLVWGGTQAGTTFGNIIGITQASANYVGPMFLWANGYIRDPQMFYCPSDRNYYGGSDSGGSVGQTGFGYFGFQRGLDFGGRPTGLPSFGLMWQLYSSYTYFNPDRVMPGWPWGVQRSPKLSEVMREKCGILADNWMNRQGAGPNGWTLLENHINPVRYNVLYGDGHVITYQREPDDMLAGWWGFGTGGKAINNFWVKSKRM